MTEYEAGGAIYTDPSNPLTTGLDDVTVLINGSNGNFQTVTTSVLTGIPGLWRILVPEGTYSVSAQKQGYGFKRISGGVVGDWVPITIEVNQANIAANQSIQFLATEPRTFTIGGAAFTDLNNPLTSGLEGVTVTVSGANGTYAGTTSSGTGLWQIADVNVGDYTVTPSKSGWQFQHLVGGVPDGQASIVIDVNEANLAANQSIQFLAERSVLHDWNGDGIVSIIGDVPPFVNCVYFQSCPDVPGNQLLSIGDCNGDGILSIIGDVPCFVDCVYFGNCPE